MGFKDYTFANIACSYTTESHGGCTVNPNCCFSKLFGYYRCI